MLRSLIRLEEEEMWCKCGPSELSPIQFLTLLLLNTEPMHGYGLLKRINEGFGESWKLNPGAVYKALSKLKKGGYIKEKKVEDRKTIYEITGKGGNSLLDCLKWSARWIEFTKECCPSCCCMEFKFEIVKKKSKK